MKRFLSSILLIAALASAPLTTTVMAASRTELTQNTDAPRVTAAPGYIIITAGNDNSKIFDIYSITGQLVRRVHLAEGQTSIELPRGCYIVKCESWSKKVVVG